MLKKYISPKDKDKILSLLNNLDEDLTYKIKTGRFSKTNEEKSTGIFYIDENNKTIAGMVFVYDNLQVLADLSTANEYQKQGIGTNLVKDAIKLRAKYLAVNENNQIAINLYLKCGFKKYYKDNDLIYMSLDGLPHKDDKIS